MLELTQAPEFAKVLKPLFAQAARCITSSHFQVAERALFLWNNDYVLSLVAQNRASVLPLVLGALEANARGHWNATVHGLSCNVRKMFQDMDAPLYDEALRRWEAGRAQEEEAARGRAATWAAVSALAATRQGRVAG